MVFLNSIRLKFRAKSLKSSLASGMLFLHSPLRATSESTTLNSQKPRHSSTSQSFKTKPFSLSFSNIFRRGFPQFNQGFRSRWIHSGPSCPKYCQQNCATAFPKIPSLNQHTDKKRFRSWLKGKRPWQMDHFAALFSWIFMGHTLFFILGTTTFLSLLLALANIFNFQDRIIKRLEVLLEEELGAKVSFESALVPSWKYGNITLQNVNISKGYDENQQVCAYPKNETKYFLKVDEINVRLSALHWFDGKGMIKSCSIKGVRGEINRRDVTYDPEYVGLPNRKAQEGDFFLQSFILEDLLVRVYDIDNFRPYSVSIVSMRLPQLRKQWLLHDMLCGESIVGYLDNSLFTIHASQSTISNNYEVDKSTVRQSHFRMDGLAIDFLNAGSSGPFAWIKNGTICMDAHFSFPDHGEDPVLQQVVDSILDSIEDLTPQKSLSETHFPYLLGKWKHLSHVRDAHHRKKDPNSEMSVVVNVKLNNLKAAVPLQAEELSYLNSALIRPVVAYMNANPTVIPFSFHVQLPIKSFDGAWSIYSSGIATLFSQEMGIALSKKALSDYHRSRKLRQIGWWSVQSLSKQLVFFWSRNLRFGSSVWGYFRQAQEWSVGGPWSLYYKSI